MLDKVELRVPGRISFQPAFRWIQREVPYSGQASPIRHSARYEGVVDLRPFGLDAMLHAYFKRRNRGPHKLELLRTGRKSLADMTRIITAIFDTDPKNLENMRIDFTADLKNIPLPLLHSCLRVKFKRSSNEHGEMDYEEYGGKRLEYFRYGVSPNCVRVYDKVAECKARFSEVARAAGQPVTFEGAFGFPEDATVSRVERQSGGGLIPTQLMTFGDLRHADDFNPFENIEIVPIVPAIPDPDRYSEGSIIKLAGIRALIDQLGYQNAYALLNRNSNAGRHFAEYRAYAQQCAAESSLSAAVLVSAYQESVRKQISGETSTIEPELSPNPQMQNTGVDMLRGLADNVPREAAG